MGVIATTVRHMFAAGMTNDAVLAAVEEIEGDLATLNVACQEPLSSTERSRKCRERQAMQRCNVAVAGHDSKEKAPTPLKENIYILPAREETKNPRGKALPLDWTPTENHFSYGQTLNLCRADVQGCAEEMVIWAGSATGTNSRKRDWNLAFKGWLRREAKQLKQKSRVPRANVAAVRGDWDAGAARQIEERKKETPINDEERQANLAKLLKCRRA